MCFSASASFAVSGGLIAANLISSRKVKNPQILPLAAIPLIFGIQQFVEGVLWLSLTQQEFAVWKSLATCIFIFIAQVVWPVWVPLSVWLAEKNEKRKKYLLGILYLGIAVGLYLLYCLHEYPVDASVSEFHIHYTLDYPVNRDYTGVFYFIPTVIPAIITSTPKMWVMGIVNFLAFLVSKFYFNEYVVSVWCFFAAILSIWTIVIVKQLENVNKTHPTD